MTVTKLAMRSIAHRYQQLDDEIAENRLRAPLRVAPIPASSGKTSRHRLNRGGDRQANHAST
ncbi:hypothetical protein C3492_04835 [Streptomyces sp. Ru62]|nr:hypothetical protein C3492_04835 [Streptomyces sp. Ru62]